MPARILETQRLILRSPDTSDAEEFARFHRENREHLAPWSPVRQEAFFTAAWWSSTLQAMEASMLAGESLALGLYLKSAPSVLVGTCKFDQIARGPFQSCMLGYSLDHRCAGNGYMTEALHSAIRCMFEEYRLHRIQANHLRENVRSAAVLARLGFVVEGLAPAYLYINGGWRDHVLTALLNPEFNEEWLK